MNASASGQPEQTLGPDRIPVRLGARDSHPHSGATAAESLLSGRHSPSNRAVGQPAGVFGERRRGTGATRCGCDGRWRYHLGGGADQPPPVHTMTRWKSASVGRSSGRSGAWPSGRVEHAVPRHCAPGWQQQAGAGKRHRRRQRALRLRSGNSAKSTDLYPRHTAACADSLDNAQVVVSDIACGVRRRHRGWSSGQPAERASANSTVSAGTAPAVTVSV